MKVADSPTIVEIGGVETAVVQAPILTGDGAWLEYASGTTTSLSAHPMSQSTLTKEAMQTNGATVEDLMATETAADHLDVYKTGSISEFCHRGHECQKALKVAAAAIGTEGTGLQELAARMELVGLPQTERVLPESFRPRLLISAGAGWSGLDAKLTQLGEVVVSTDPKKRRRYATKFGLLGVANGATAVSALACVIAA